MVCEQSCSFGHKMDHSLWQTFSTFDLIHSSHKWIQAMLSFMKIGTVSGLWFFVDPEDSKSTSSGLLCIFGSHTFVPRSWMYKKQTSVFLTDGRTAGGSSKTSHFGKRVCPEEQKAQKKMTDPLRQRKITRMFCEHFWATGTLVAFPDYSDLFSKS